MNMEKYLAAEGISKSGLDQIARSPAHYQSWLRYKPEPTPAMLFGSALHCALLEPNRFTENYSLLPDVNRTTKEGKAAYAEWQALNAGRTGLKPEQMHTIVGMQDAFHAHPLLKSVLKGAQIEQSIFWEDPVTGVKCKARPDIITSNNLVIDVKTTDDASPDGFSRSSWTYRYHVQASYYMQGVAAALKFKPESFLFVVIEKYQPYAIAVYMADSAMVNLGIEHARRDLDRYAACLKEDRWPAYSSEVQPLALPRWAFGT
jgi:hypothetical protein